MKKIRLEFGPWEPDAALLGGAHAPDVCNVVPAARGWMPLEGPSPLSAAPLAGRPLGGMGHRHGEELLTWAATSTGIYALEAGQWAVKHEGANAVPGRQFAVYGSAVYALFGSQLLKAAFKGATTEEFKEVGQAPSGETLAVVRDHLVIGRLVGALEAIRWSGIDRPDEWPEVGSDEAQFVQSDMQVFPEGGRVQAVTGAVACADGLVFLEGAVQRMAYVGTPYIFQFDALDRHHGLLAPLSAVTAGGRCHYLGTDGWKVTDGAAVRGIGAERVDRWFFETCAPSRFHEVRGAYDARRRIVVWTFPTQAAPEGAHDTMLIYSPALDRWSRAALTSTALFADSARGMDLEGLDVFGPLDGPQMPLPDAPSLRHGMPGITLFDASNRAARLSGLVLPASLDTAEHGGDRMMLHGLCPLVDDGAVFAMPLYRGRRMDARRAGPCTAAGRDGVCPQHVSAVWMAARVQMPEGGSWSRAWGVEALVEKE